MYPLLVVSLRNQALFVPAAHPSTGGRPLREPTATLLADLHRLGFTVTEALRDALDSAPDRWQADALRAVREVRGVDANWTPLVRGWDVPTGESAIDHVVTWFNNLFKGTGTALPCGHLIPPGTFPLERYTGCPYCGTPFELARLQLSGDGQGSRRTVLDLWREADADRHLAALLASKTALDATQRASLTALLDVRGLPDAPAIAMKETRMLVVDALVQAGRGDQAQPLFSTPTDVLRYLWYAHTGDLQLTRPRTLLRRRVASAAHRRAALDRQTEARSQARHALRLRYPRPMCRQVGRWLEGLDLSPQAACEAMHPRRRMWVRFLRALRLHELARRPEHPRLAALLQAFHARDYRVHAGRVDRAIRAGDTDEALRLLEQRPGVYARSLFRAMLHLGPDPVVGSFARVVDRVPARLLFTLAAYAQDYFVDGRSRLVKPPGGKPTMVPPNPHRARYDRAALVAMPGHVEDLCLLAMRRRFAALPTDGAATVYIDPALYKMPVAIGERSDTVQDLPAALMGARFPVDGQQVRLFLQWGVGLPAQHLDMDLSCRVAYPDREEVCAFYALTATGCKHSGDIRRIPDQVGTAEYIELDLPTLQAAGARYAVFFCNAYSTGGLPPGLVVGWMSSAHPMRISPETGVAYDPSCVQHQVRVTRDVHKGLVFGVLDVAAREVVWLELPAPGQLAATFDLAAAEALLGKLNARLTIGALLSLKAEAQGLTVVDTPDADQAYTARWGLDAAAVSALLVD